MIFHLFNTCIFNTSSKTTIKFSTSTPWNIVSLRWHTTPHGRHWACYIVSSWLKWMKAEGTQNHVTLTETRAEFTETQLLHLLLLLLLLLDLTEPPIELELSRKWALLGVRAWNEANLQWPVTAVPSWHAVAMDAMSGSWNLTKNARIW